MNLPFDVVLASRSPRRVEILRRIIPEFDQDPADIDEEEHTTDDPWHTAEKLAEQKAQAVFDRHPSKLVIAGDTVVALPKAGQYELLAKPESTADAETMLRSLSGSKHLVITGICLRWPGGATTLHETTAVTFRDLSDEEIQEYVATGEPMDKAGGYALQGGAAKFVSQIEGSYSNVVGMPEERVVEALAAIEALFGQP